MGPDGSQSERDAAARQLVARKSDTARQYVKGILGSASHEGQLAVAKALARAPNPDPALVGPLFNLIGPNTALTDAAAAALADYHDSSDASDVFKQLSERASNLSLQESQESTRSAAIRAMGSFGHTYSAQTLMDLLQRPDQSEGIQNAACEALSEMTGLFVNDPDVQKWQQWWNLHKSMSDKDFVSYLQANRDAVFSTLSPRFRQLVGLHADGEIYDTYAKTYAGDNADQKRVLLTDLLQNAAPDLRAAGAHIVADELSKGPLFDAKIMTMFRPMIGDPATEVRYWVAIALDSDTASFDVLLAQLDVETDDVVKGLIARAIAPIGNLRAVQPLDSLLADRSYQVARDAALALAVLGPTLSKDDQALARKVSLDLVNRVSQANGPGTESLRSALVTALAAMQGHGAEPLPEVLELFHRLLNIQEPINVRLYAIRGIGNIGRDNTADWIVQFLNPTNDGAIRLETAAAMGKLSVPDLYQKLVDVIENDTDSTVRDKAWVSLQSWISIMTLQQLEKCATALANDPEKQLFVYEALVALLEKSPPSDALAEFRQQIGDLQEKLKRPAEAAESYDKAFAYWLSNGGHQATISTLTHSKMGALLESAQYSAAASFAADVIKNRPADIRDVCAQLATEAEVLAATNPAACRELVDAAQKMDPHLPEPYGGRIADVRKKLAQPATIPATAPATQE
jgi:HEAT repeat protein